MIERYGDVDSDGCFVVPDRSGRLVVYLQKVPLDLVLVRPLLSLPNLRLHRLTWKHQNSIQSLRSVVW